MKEFLCAISKMVGQLDMRGSIDEGMVREMGMKYQSLSQSEREICIQLLDELLEEDYRAYFLIMSALLAESKDAGRILPCIKERLVGRGYPLWERYSLMHQLKMMLFRNQMLCQDKHLEYRVSREIYRNILKEVQEGIGAVYPYLPFQGRKKVIVVTAIQILHPKHAPTKKIIDFCRFFSGFGYTVKVFVCFHPGKISRDNIFWHGALEMNNSIEKTTFFEYDTGIGKIKGYNAVLHPQNFLRVLRETVGLIWDEKPEFVFEIGEETLLAGLCSHFTTTVTLGMTKAVPVTVSPIVAHFFDYSEEERRDYLSLLDENQQMINLKHYSDAMEPLCIGKEKQQSQRKSLGIPIDDFVILLAGNRLDEEITERFWEILYEILGIDSQISVLFIGDCPKLEKKAIGEGYAGRMFFAGYAENFREMLTVGDLFLNPPRQGGGTGAAYAILEGIPVVTLDHCDVESSVGKEFVCGSQEDMAALVYRYFSEPEFIEQKKEACMKRVEEKRNVDSTGNLKNLFRLVETVARKEEETDGT